MPATEEAVNVVKKEREAVIAGKLRRLARKWGRNIIQVPSDEQCCDGNAPKRLKTEVDASAPVQAQPASSWAAKFTTTTLAEPIDLDSDSDSAKPRVECGAAGPSEVCNPETPGGHADGEDDVFGHNCAGFDEGEE